MISDHFWPNSLTSETYYDIAHNYTRLEPVEGVFFFDVNGDYARYGREADAGRAQRIYWFDRKPFVPCRYVLWDSNKYQGISRTGQQLATTINSLPANPSNPDSYSFVMVHAWSYGLQTMTEIAAAVDNLASHVRVVTPDEFIRQIYMNLSPCGAPPLQADISNNCRVDLQDFSIIANDWLTYNPSSAADLWKDDLVDTKDMYLLISQWLDENSEASEH